jgi:hypothetical protein
MVLQQFLKFENHLFYIDDITNRGTLDVKLASLIWKILLKHAIKMDSVIKFSAVACAVRMLPMYA